MAEMPKPTEAHRKLMRLAGRWEGAETLAPSPFGPGGPATGRTAFHPAVDGLFLLGDYEEEKGGRVVFRGHSVFGVETGSEEIVWYWFDSMGRPPDEPSRGRFEGDRLVLHATFDQGEGRYAYELIGDDRYRFTAEGSPPGGDFKPFVTGEYRRVG
jgi:hypothetical protein